MSSSNPRFIFLTIVLSLFCASQVAAQAPSEVTVDLFADGQHGTAAVRNNTDLAAILERCIFDTQEPEKSKFSPRAFALQCVVPYIHGLWLDPTVLYRSKDDIVAQATDKLIEHPDSEPFPVFYPSVLSEKVHAELDSLLGDGSKAVLEPLPNPLPQPSLDPNSLYNNIGLLYLPNPYVVPGDTFNEMYGWDSFFIIKGLLASVDYVMANPTALVWSPTDKSLSRLSAEPGDADYYRTFAEKLFQTAKGMVDNHIFEIAYYGGFVLNANRTYYLTRSQPPLFAREAIAVLDSARRYGFDYAETLAPYFSVDRPGFDTPQSYGDWILTEVLPAAKSYYAYWTDPAWTNPTRAPDSSATNPRVANVEFDGASHKLYLFGTAGVGPAPEVARSTHPQNRKLYSNDADFFEKSPSANPDRLFYNPDRRCNTAEPVDNCGDPIYGLTQAYYAADRAVRASGFDLSSRFGVAGQWAMHYAPISLNVLLLQMAEDIDRLSATAGLAPPTGKAALAARRDFLARFFKRSSNNGYSDRFAVGEPPADVPLFAYPYATQTYLLWANVLTAPKDRQALLGELRANDNGKSFLAPLTTKQFGIPTSLTVSGKQWDAPYAWAPIQFFAVDGLIAADFPSPANAAMQQWIAAVNGFFADTGVLIEKYDVADPMSDPRVKVGYAQAQRGFGWTNAVYMMFVNRLYQRL